MVALAYAVVLAYPAGLLVLDWAMSAMERLRWTLERL